MTAAEKLEQIKRERTPHSTEELVRLGEARYKEIRSELEAHHHGDFIMIEVDTGDYFIGSTLQAALDGAQSAYPDKVFYLMRIGGRVVFDGHEQEVDIIFTASPDSLIGASLLAAYKLNINYPERTVRIDQGDL